MADMSKVSEARSWLRETIAESKYPSSALRRVERTAVEQRANFEAARFAGRWPGGMREAEYRRAVELLEGALPDLRLQAEEEARADAAAKAEAERARRSTSPRSAVSTPAGRVHGADNAPRSNRTS